MLLASSEALTNAIEHGSPAGGRVDIDLDVTRDRADIRIVDQGVPGTATPRLPSGPPPATAERGRGLIIISRIADDFEMVSAGGGTEVHVGFWRHAAAEEADEVAVGARAAGGTSRAAGPGAPGRPPVSSGPLSRPGGVG